MPSTNPYKQLPEKAFWRPAVSEKGLFDIQSIWTPKFAISYTDSIATFGSCFAQHIGRELRQRQFNWLDAEPEPPFLKSESKSQFGYGVFSARTGNIYTAAGLRQWLYWAFERMQQPTESWTDDGRIIDPFRPTIEPDGFASLSEMKLSRQATLSALRRVVAETSVFVFTLGLTECWTNAASGAVYTTCPGVAGGTFDRSSHLFKNMKYPDVHAAMTDCFSLMKEVNPDIRVLLTVSPVPLTATAAENQHVLNATSYSKSTLRAVAGDLADEFDFCDYFPSYELITSFPFRAAWFSPNLRTVSRHGVDHVMRTFFSGLNLCGKQGQVSNTEKGDVRIADTTVPLDEQDQICEDALLDAQTNF